MLPQLPRRAARAAGCGAIAVIAAHTTPAGAQDAPTPRLPEVVATGEGRRSLAADRASVMIAVETRARTPAASGALNADRITAVRAAVAGVGVAREQVTTTGYMVRPDAGPSGRDSAFVATNTVRVELRQLPLLSRVIDTALTAGATHVEGVRYWAQSTAAAERDALADAVRAARARAEAMARAAGGTLGELLELSTEPPREPRPFDAFAAGMLRAQATPLTPGELEVWQRVTARWRLAPGAR